MKRGISLSALVVVAMSVTTAMSAETQKPSVWAEIHSGHQQMAAQIKRAWESKFAYRPSVKSGICDISITTSHGPLVVRLAALLLDEKTGRPILEENSQTIIINEAVLLPGGTVVPYRLAESERVVDVRLSKNGDVFILYRGGQVKQYDPAWDTLKVASSELVQCEGPFSFRSTLMPIGHCAGDYIHSFFSLLRRG